MIDGPALFLSSDRTLRERLEPALFAAGDTDPTAVIDPFGERAKA